MRTLVLGTTLAAALGGLTVLAPSPATAVVLDPTSQIAVQVGFTSNPVSPDACTAGGTGTKSDSTLPLVPDGVARTVTVSSDGTYTRTGAPTDISRGLASVTRSVTISQAGGQLSHISLRDSFTASVTPDLGADQRCHMTSAGQAQTLFYFNLVRPTLVTVTVKSAGMYAQAVLYSGLPSFSGGLSSLDKIKAVGATAGGPRATSTGTVLFPPGEYAAGSAAAQGSIRDSGAASGSVTTEISFEDPGVATMGAKGDGKKYVDLPALQDCNAHAAVASWTSKAGKGKDVKVKKAVFKVGAQKVGKAKRPEKKDRTKLTGLPVEGPVTVTGTLKLVNGDKVTVERTYRACG